MAQTGRRMTVKPTILMAQGLITASKNGDIDSVKRLLEKGADVNARDKDGFNSLMLASFYGHIEIVKLLLHAGADVNVGSRSPIVMASEKGHTNIIKLLLEKGADVNAENNYGNTPLMLASGIGYTEIVKLLLEKGADVNRKNKLTNNTPLLFAVGSEKGRTEKGRTDIIKLLLDAGADVDAENDHGNTPLIIASGMGYTEIVKLLLEKGADVNRKTKQLTNTALLFASDKGHTDIIKLLLDAGADVNAKNISGSTSLMFASDQSHTETVKLLLNRGADVDAKDKNGRNSLMMVSSKSEGDVNIAKVLVENDIWVNEQDNDGNTALIEASEKGRTDIVEVLIEEGFADVNMENKNGVTPLIAASPGGYTDIVKRLLDAGADVNAKEIRGKTPLILASGASKLYVVKLLLERGADVNMKDNDNNTALDLASNGKIKMLLNNALGKQELWKGMTRSDISQLDSIFGEGASNHSICPICLQYAERVDGCMYMTHNCTKHGNEYHEGLYNIYKNKDGFIDWCTICNRIAKGHNHFKLADVNTTTPSVIVEPGDPFEGDCSLSSGGGGPMEKLARFRRFREYALDLQDDIGKKSKQQAFEELVEEVWNAPIRREGRLLKEIKNKKNWNISSSKFPLPIATENVAYPNIPYNGPLPTKINSGRNNIGMNNNVPVLRFVHQQPDGSEQTHGISEENLEGFIKSTIGGFGGEGGSGYCFMYPGCKARLYPQEVKDYIPDELYNNYKMRFNQKFKTASGGGSEDLIQEANDFMCVNPKRGGRRNTKRRQNRKKNKKTKSRRL